MIPSASGPSEVYLGEAIPVLFVIFVAFLCHRTDFRAVSCSPDGTMRSKLFAFNCITATQDKLLLRK